MAIETSRPIREQVTDIIRRDIIEGALLPGQVISERELSQRLNVSTMPIKEAFRSLQAEGLLISAPRSRTMVSQFACQNLEHVSLIRSALEGTAARIAVGNLTQPEIKKMEGVLDKALDLIEKKRIKMVLKANSEFHAMLRAASRNAYLIGRIDTLQFFEQSFRYKALQDMDEALLGYNEHREILETIKAGDADRAETLLRDHIRRSSRHVLAGRRPCLEPPDETADG